MGENSVKAMQELQERFEVASSEGYALEEELWEMGAPTVHQRSISSFHRQLDGDAELTKLGWEPGAGGLGWDMVATDGAGQLEVESLTGRLPGLNLQPQAIARVKSGQVKGKGSGKNVGPPVNKVIAPKKKVGTPVKKDGTSVKKVTTPVKKGAPPAKKGSPPVKKRAPPPKKGGTPKKGGGKPVRAPPGFQCPPLVPTEKLGKGKIDGVHQFPLCGLGRPSTFRLSIFSTSLNTVWRGWGTTLGSIGSFIGSLDPPVAKCFADVLFNRDRLGLTMVRYHIPGGYNARNSPKMAEDPMNSRGYWPWPKSTALNGTADVYQVNFLRYAAARGAKLDAVVYAPPWWMTLNGRVEGADRYGQCNLNFNYAASFANYIKTAVSFIQRKWRLQFFSVSPFNEPLEGWWMAKTTKLSPHEGCNFNVTEINRMIPYLRRFMPTLRLGGVDSWVRSMGSALPKPWQSVDATGGLLNWKAFNHFTVHGYRTKQNTSPQDDFCSLCRLSNQARRLKKALWQSEWGPLGIAKASDLDLALFMARKIVQHINLLGAEAWFHWQVMMRMNSFWGIIRLPFREPPEKIWATKSYFAFAHFSRFMLEGAIPLLVSQECGHTVLAMYKPPTPPRSRPPAVGTPAILTINIVNQKGFYVNLSLLLRGLTCPRRTRRSLGCAIVGSVTDDNRNLAPIVVSRPALAPPWIRVPPFSIVTVRMVRIEGSISDHPGGANPFCSSRAMNSC